MRLRSMLMAVVIVGMGMAPHAAQAVPKACSVVLGPGSCSYTSDGGTGVYAVATTGTWTVVVNGVTAASGGASATGGLYFPNPNNLVTLTLTSLGTGSIADTGTASGCISGCGPQPLNANVVGAATGAVSAFEFNGTVALPSFPCPSGCVGGFAGTVTGIVDGFVFAAAPVAATFDYNEVNCALGTAQGQGNVAGMPFWFNWSRVGVTAALTIQFWSGATAAGMAAFIPEVGAFTASCP